VSENLDRLEEFENASEPRSLPGIFHLLFWGLIAFGIYYIAAYTPVFSGWSQQAEYESSIRK
jgi:hypothetical protein